MLGFRSIKRSTIEELVKFSKNKLGEIYKNENLKSNINKKNDTSLFKRIFKLSKNKKYTIDFNQDDNNDIVDASNNNDGDISSNSQGTRKSHPLAYHKSRILDGDIAKSKELYYISNNSSLNDLDINSFNSNVDLNKGELNFIINYYLKIIYSLTRLILYPNMIN